MSTAGAGPLRRDWRQRRRLSQLDPACLAEVTVERLFPADDATDRAVRGPWGAVDL